MAPFLDSNDFAPQGGEEFIFATSQAAVVGDIIAKITTGPDTGKFGPFALNATDGRQTLANVIGPTFIRISANDTTGIQERVLPNQADRFFTFCARASAARANQMFYYDATGTRQTLNSEASLLTKNYLAGHGFFFKD